ncbi:hypothetical protein FFT09_02520 [Saccharomonospora piscinae]|uniref:hypothetical protein n=1 Tax=Saccharomonospora piscinae TaxID=687388 RepID=UPI001106E691|nr:hypothetical protein [Saccharomonospora piscinae]TLW94764.1 hypothetical protein FFT09_02520 [Saccharomonospora piscinae]
MIAYRAMLDVPRALAQYFSRLSKRDPREVHEKAVRLVLERLDEIESPFAAARAIAPMVDVHDESLRAG